MFAFEVFAGRKSPNLFVSFEVVNRNKKNGKRKKKKCKMS